MPRTHIDSDIRRLAHQLRNNPTDAERKLWRALREWAPPGTNFRRQAPIGRFVADFACHSTKIVIEVDGSQHAEPSNEERDNQRTQWLKSQGYHVLRFDNRAVLLNINGVLDVISELLNATSGKDDNA